MGGLERIAFFTPTTASSRWRLRRWTARWRQRRGEWSQLPKVEVVLAVSLVLHGGGIFIANTQQKQTDTFMPFMLSLEVVGPGYGLSMAPSATPHWRDASWRVSWQAVTATAAYSCDRAVAALLLRLEGGWRWRRRGGTGSDGDGLKISIYYFSFSYFGLFFSYIPGS
jgi:hypothetical protein